MMHIPIARPFFDSAEKEIVLQPLESGWVVQGPFVKRFEDLFADFARVPHAVAASSCTAALHISMAILGLGPGDEVIVPAFTWISTPNVIEYMGAKPVFCDIDLQTFNIDAGLVQDAISSRTVGMIPVHLFGLCADMEALLTIAGEHHLWVVEDAACAFGALYHGRHAGTFGKTGCFSFHPRKAITTGEGGMLTTAESELDALARAIRDHGASRTDRARHEGSQGFLMAEFKHLGYNYRMTDIQAAIGCAQMSKAEYILEERARCARNYDALLHDIEWLRKPPVPPGLRHAYQSYVCLFAPEVPDWTNVGRLGELRNRLMDGLEKRGISTRQGTHAPVNTEYYVQKYGYRPDDFPNATLAEVLSITLPLYVQMTPGEQEFVVEQSRDVFSAL